MAENNCATCKHKRGPEGGHCYMFREEPADLCMQHQERYPQSLAATNPRVGA